MHTTARRPHLAAVSTHSESLAAMIEEGWAADPAARPSAGELRDRLKKIGIPPLEWPSAASFRLSSFARWQGSHRTANAN